MIDFCQKFWALAAAVEAKKAADAEVKKAEALSALSALSTEFGEDHRAVEYILAPIQLECFEPSHIEAHYEELEQVDIHLMSMFTTLGTIARDYTDEADLVKAMTALTEYLEYKQVDCYQILDQAAISVHEQIPEEAATTNLCSTNSISSVNGLLSVQMRCSITKLPMIPPKVPKAATSVTIHTTSSIDLSLLCKGLYMSSLPCMMTTTRRQSQNVDIMWKPPSSFIVATPIIEVDSDNMNSCTNKLFYQLLRV